MGLEYITQPQVFLGGLTALGPGIQGLSENYPLLTTYYSWTSTAAVAASSFPIPIELGSIYSGASNSGSFIVSIGGVIQPPSTYTIDVTNRLLNFSSLVSADIEVAVTQLATAAPSSQSFDFVKSVSAEFLTLSARNIIGDAISITAANTNITNANIDKLFVTNLTALSSVLNVVNITQIELSGFNISGELSATSANINTVNSTNITLADNGSFIGATSATTMNVGFLSARGLDLVHTPANDGVDPVFNIGETDTAGFSGFRIRYEEPTNRLIASSRTGTTILTSFMITTNTGQVGISGLPAPGQALTVTGGISASGNIVAANIPAYYYLENNRTAISGSQTPPLSFVTYFDPTAALALLPNKVYELEYNLFYSRNSTLPVSFALSSTLPLNHISVIGIQAPAGGFAGTGNAAAALLGTGFISAQPGNFIPVLSTGTLVANISYFTRFTTQIQTSATNIPFTTLAVMVCAGAAPGNTSTITPLKGSYRKITLLP